MQWCVFLRILCTLLIRPDNFVAGNCGAKHGPQGAFSHTHQLSILDVYTKKRLRDVSTVYIALTWSLVLLHVCSVRVVLPTQNWTVALRMKLVDLWFIVYAFSGDFLPYLYIHSNIICASHLCSFVIRCSLLYLLFCDL